MGAFYKKSGVCLVGFRRSFTDLMYMQDPGDKQ